MIRIGSYSYIDHSGESRTLKFCLVKIGKPRVVVIEASTNKLMTDVVIVEMQRLTGLTTNSSDPKHVFSSLTTPEQICVAGTLKCRKVVIRKGKEGKITAIFIAVKDRKDPS